MHQPDIAPLAKRLAEENNVDWRRLQGSGDGGRVVERDVLEYLARVMAGDEALDPTPEPVPEGMTAWPEADVRMAHDDDDGDLFEGTSTVEDDIFLFDDDMPGAAPAAAGEAPVDLDAPVPAKADAAVDIDVDTDLAADLAADLGLSAGEAADQGGVEDIDEEDLLVSGDAEPEPVATPQVDPAPAAPAAPAAPPDAALELHEADGIPDLFAADDAGVMGAAEPDDPSPALFASDDHEAPAPRWDAGPELGDDLASPGTSPEVAPGPDLDEPHAAAAEAPAASVTLESVEDEVSGSDVVASPAPSPVALPVTPPPVPADAADGEPPPVAEPASMPGATGAALPLWSHGHVWRRHIDLSALVAAQLDVAGELGRDAPIPLTAFLIRAAHKALGGQGAVALAVVDAAGARTVLVPAAADFVQAVAACERALNGTTAAASASEGGFQGASEGPSEGASEGASGEVASYAVDHGDAVEAEPREPDLIVADLSDLGVDDAVLRLGAPVLTLGRVLIDTQSGARRAVLALAGDGAEGPGAARRLARVADLLEAPVRVVL